MHPSPRTSPFSAFVFRSTAWIHFLLHVLCIFVSLFLSLFCEHSKRHTLGDAEKAVTLRELAKSFSLCLDSFINRDVRAPSKTSRRRDNRSGSSRNSSLICPDREYVEYSNEYYVIGHVSTYFIIKNCDIYVLIFS